MSKTERDCIVTMKVTQEEKELLQTRADNFDMNVSEFIRFVTLSGTTGSRSILAENSRLNEKLKELNFQSTFCQESENGESVIAIPCSHAQKEAVLKIYGNCYGDGREPTEQILNYLIQDAIFPHWSFGGSKLTPSIDVMRCEVREGINEVSLNVMRRNYPALDANISLSEIHALFGNLDLHTTPEDREVLSEL